MIIAKIIRRNLHQTNPIVYSLICSQRERKNGKVWSYSCLCRAANQANLTNLHLIRVERLEKKSKAKALKTEEVVAEKKPSDAEHRQQMIDDEFKGIMKETEDNELDEPFEPEAVEALRIAANKLAYLKKYYNSFTDEFVYFPSVTKLLVNYSMIEEAEKHYFDEEDEFPIDYSAALRSVACEKVGDDDDDENDDDYMMRVAADVDLS
jgi:hypothetical protein